MFIKELFVKNVERDMQSVVKVSNNEMDIAMIEIDEYVVTDEIFLCIKKFVVSYRNTFLKQNDEIGFWISGFFGSGKSHFLKILFYILNNIGMDILIKNNECLNKIKEDIKFLSEIDKDVVIFNIDSKNGKDDSILDIFVNQFNSMRGFSKNYGFICEFEEQLVRENIFEIFKTEFFNFSGIDWEYGREKFYFYKNELIRALEISKNITYFDSEEYFSNVERNYKMNIEKFANKVSSYVLERGENYNIVFMIDEVSQFIADDVNKMLNLQTIVEELSAKCFGKVFVVVTSHVDIISMTRDKQYDFSKIQGRFSNRFYLSSVNMEEVLHKRLLLKKESSILKLYEIYEDRKYYLQNFLKFDFIYDSDITEISGKRFVDSYPFFHYQLKVLQDVIYFMMKNNVISDEISSGERSIINFFQIILKSFKDYDLGKVVPFYMFYDPISDLIDYNHKYVFMILKNYVSLNSFDINVLKILFLIKYVKNIIPNVDTITSLLIFDIEDNGDIKAKVLESLKKLMSEGFVNNDGENFYFLSKIERDINYKIIKTDVSYREIKEFLCEKIFNGIWNISKIKYKNRVTFSINQILDELNYKIYSKNLIGIKFLMTNYDENFSVDSVRVLSSIENNVIVYLNDDKNLIDEINIYLKLEKFLKYNKCNLKDDFEKNLKDKENEIKNRLSRIEILLVDAIKNSNVFVNGEEISTNFSEVNDIFKNAINKLIFCRFNKFEYIVKSVENYKNIIKIFNDEVFLNEIVKNNSLFFNELLNFVDGFEKIKVCDVVEYFKSIPYGFTRVDILFGVLYFIKNGKFLCANKFDEVIVLCEDKTFINKLEILKLNEISSREFNFCKKFFGDIFNKKYLSEDFSKFIEECKKDFENLNFKICEIKKIIDKDEAYPSKKFLINFQNFCEKILGEANDFIKNFNYDEKIINDFEIFDVVYNFYNSVQFDIFRDGLKISELFVKDKNFIDDLKIFDIFSKIENILSDEYPYMKISKLKIYINEFRNLHENILSEKKIEIENFIMEEILEKVDDEMIFELKNKLYNCTNIFDVYGVKMESIFVMDKKLS